ncbi:oligosaccharyl transferase, archaeosortase A system-associated [Halodesulfurarchaeum formicicum]|uniref:dolichyl-phosphooligosaccharide-protein glycotransferase n=1 Tax=Halodesulfurarchaeum formicicum TaxID=1873524 RepID=A0A1J1ABR6_9EURY|nr:oligosaccharyl transferase, archaeosortase A system-associated [Halodesulfurarchaeum formicicum]APE95325.1 dolichyl-diphosphooligosaccharide--protein glycosyltransferase [Halodesulfurarchaeum formicicum]
MSDDSTASGSTIDMEALTDTFRRWYHVPALVLAVVTMFFIRIQSADRFLQPGKTYLAGNDAWYHLRQVQYSVENGLATMPFDVWTGFAAGNNSGQFGTLFDQLIATAALIVGLGDPSSQQVATVVAFAPAIFGALVAIPTFLIARRFGGNIVGVIAAFVLALLPGLFLQRGTIGSADHNVAEPLFMSLAILGLLVAFAVADRERPVWEQLLELDIAGLRNVIGWGVLAGVAMAAYMWMWPPGVFLVGIVGIFLLVSLSSDVTSGVSPDHTAIPATIAMVTTGILMLVPLRYLEFSATGYTLLQVIAPLVVAAGAVFLSWLAREWEARNLEPTYYPPAVLGILVVSTGAGLLVVPDLVGMILNELIRIVGLSTGATTRTISEAQPFLQSRADRLGLGAWQAFFYEYGAAFFLALLGGLWMILRPHLLSSDSRRISMAAGVLLLGGLFVGFPAIPTALGGIIGLSGDLFGLLVLSLAVAAALIAGDYPTEQILLVVWAAFMLAAALTQVRFNYYLVVPVAILAAYAVGRVIDVFGVSLATLSPRSIDWSHVMLVVTIVLLLFAPMVAPISFANQDGRQVQMQTAVQTGANAGPGAVTEWDSTLGWMQNNTPEVGNYGGAGNADQLDYDGTYAIPEGDDYDYPEGAYGVMSWWDYGHWITVLGERIPVANPFQQHATQAANYLLAGDEETANERLAATDEDDAETQYVAVDYKMVDTQGKFSAPTVFYNANDSLSYDNMTDGQILGPNAGTYLNSGFRPPVTTLKTQRYYESQMVRLYHHHGSAVEANTVVQYENREYEQYQNPVPTYATSRTFRSSEAAQEFAANDSNAIVGGVADFPREDLKALEHYRLVRVSEDATVRQQKLANLEFREGEQPTWVKLFERVPGATIEGEGPADSTVTATVELESNAPYNDSTFTYTQHAETDANGDFEMTLPYASTDYDAWGPEDGYTNTSVRATGPYEFSTPTTVDRANETMTTHSATVDVPEGTVIGASDEPITVTLDEQVIDTGQEDTQTDTNTTDTTNETVESVGTSGLPEVTAQPTE